VAPLVPVAPVEPVAPGAIVAPCEPVVPIAPVAPVAPVTASCPLGAAAAPEAGVCASGTGGADGADPVWLTVVPVAVFGVKLATAIDDAAFAAGSV
jgi:hypothetical protein